MALKRLDEEFELKPGTQLLPYMKRLLPSLEGRFQNLESTQDLLAGVNEDIRAAALLRMNEILIPATQDILEVTTLGFLLAPVTGLMTIGMGYMTFQIELGPQAATFTPSPYLIIEHSPDDYGILRTISYDQELGILEVDVTAVHGNPGPWDDWMVSSTPGMADSTKLYHDAVGPMHDTVVTAHADVVIKHQEIVDAANDLVEAGLDLFNYVRRDGTTAFDAVQTGIHPNANSNDNALVTSYWTRQRMNEYLRDSMSSSGASMTGPLYLHAAPSQPMMAANKAYVDGVLGAGGNVNSSVTISTNNPYLALRTRATGENRMVQSMSVDAILRWSMNLGDASPESGSNNGSNFSLARYTDTGVLIDYPISINRATGIMSSLGKQVMTAGGGANITGGFTFTPYSNPPGNLTLNSSLGNYQYINNSGGFTISAPGYDCAIDLMIINVAGAGTISFFGFMVGANTGDLLSTTVGHRFIISFRRINAVSTYVIKALQ